MNWKMEVTVNVLLFHPKVMSTRFYINSRLIWNEVAEKLFMSFFVLLSFCFLAVYNYTLHD